MQRKLGIFERAQDFTDRVAPFNVVGVLRLDGGPSPELLGAALASLQRRHPMLGVAIKRHGRCYSYVPGAPAITPESIRRADDEHWKAIAEQELNRAMATATGPLMRCLFLDPGNPDGRSEIVLTFHHSVIDAASGANLCHELLSLCGQQSEALEPLPPMGPSEKYLPARHSGLGRYWRCASFLLAQMADEARFRWGSRGHPKPVIHPTGRCRVLPVRLSAEDTAALLRRARTERVSANSVISATMLLAVHKHRYSGRDLPLRYMTMADLRRYLEPPVAAPNLGSHFATFRFTLPISREHGFWEISRKINQQVYTAARRGDKFTALLLSGVMIPAVLRFKPGRLAATATSYGTTSCLQRRYGRLRLTDIHAFVSNLPGGPEYTALVRLFDGELMWDILYLDTDMDQAEAQVIADEMMAMMRAAAKAE